MKTLLPRILTKKDDPDSYKAIEELDEALRNAEEEGIRNIALTGPYGSGKSSVLNTLKQDFKDRRNYLSISLATLQSGSEDNDTGEDESKNSDDKEALNRRIEYSILQQLIYREKASTVPNSRFKRITYFTKKELWGLVLWTIGFIIAFFIAFEPEFAKVDSAYEWLNWGKVNALFDFLAMGYMLFCSAYVIKYFVQGYSNSKLNKLNLKDGEIDIKEDNSIFNKHLDEILYFFRATEYNVVIIEDLDRFETSDIYLKLRELNQLINESEEIKRHITFVYAVKDDVFDDEHRTKFFDYIITVIPVINPSNSKDILKKQLSEIGLPNNTISDDDLASIAFFIPDMRILTNIVNEFQQYREKLSKTGQPLNMTKLLAMIVYKNYYPKDFAELHRRKGKVYACISQKKAFIEIATKEINDSIAACNKEIQAYKEAKKWEIVELKKLFLVSLLNQLSSMAVSIRISNQYYAIESIASSDQLFNELLSLDSVHYHYLYSYNASNVSTDYTRINVMSAYQKSPYYTKIQQESTDSKTLQNRLNSLNRNLRTVSGLRLSSILLKYPHVRTSDKYVNLGLSELMNIFLIEGYIDEDYYDYISYFYEGMISPADREFILSIRQLQTPEYNRHIDKIENFVKELRPNNFFSDSILNIELLDYLTSNNSRNYKISDFRNRMVDVIDASPKKYDFLSEFCISSLSPGAFLVTYYESRLSSIWKDVIALPNDEKKNNLIISIIQFGGNLNDEIFNWISENYLFIHSQYAYIENDRLRFIIENATFTALMAGNDPLLNNVISEYSYIITKDNLCVVLATVYDKPETTIQDITLDNIQNCGNDDVKSYLLDEDNFSTTFDCMNIQYNNESLESIEFILNSNLPEDKKRQFLMGQECRRENIIGLTDEQAMLMYECNLIVPTWENVSILYEKYGSNISLVLNFIKSNCDSLSIEKSASGIDKEVELFDLLFGSNEHLTFEEYVSLDKAFECDVEGDEYLTTLSKERFELLLRNRKIPFDKENIAVLNGTERLSTYLIFWNKKFIENIDWDYMLSAEVCLVLLQSDRFSTEEKLTIIRKAQYPVTQNNESLSNIVLSIFSENLDGISYTIAELRSLIKQSSLLVPKKIIANHVLIALDYNENEFIDVLQSIGDPSFTAISGRHKKPEIDKIVPNLELLKTLKNKGFISSAKDEGEYMRPNYFKS